MRGNSLLSFILGYLLIPFVMPVPLCANLEASGSAFQSRVLEPQKFDEFGDINQSDLKARLDNFAIMLQNAPDTIGFIIVYRSRRDLPGLSHSLALRTKHYMLHSRLVSPTRLALVDGGVADHLVQELWIVPRGTAPKPRDDVRIGYFYVPDHSWKFFEYGFLPRELFRQFGVDRDFDSDAEYLEAYANELKKNSTHTACIIVYAQYDPRRKMVDWAGDYEPKVDIRLDSPGTAQRRLRLEKERLTKSYGIPARRIRTINGGYRKRRAVELWIVPAGEPMPIATPNSFPSGQSTKRP